MTQRALPELPGGWVWTRLGDIGTINPKNIGDNIEDDTEVTFLPMRCVEELTGHFDLSLTKRFSEVKKGYTPFVDGDLIFAKITPCMENGKVAIVHSLKNGVGFGSTEFHVIRLSEMIPKKFFFYFIVRDELRKDAQRKMTGSAGQLRVPSTYMQQLSIPLPPLPEQHRIITKLEELFTRLDAGVSELKKTQAHLKRYRQSVLKAACEGKLVPTEAELAKVEGYAYEPADVLLARILKERREKAGKGAKYKELEVPDTSGLHALPEGWMWVTSRILSWYVTSGSRDWKKYYSNSGAIFIRTQDINKNELSLDNIAFVALPKKVEGKRSIVQKNDILIIITGANVGKVALVEKYIDEAYVSQSVALIKLVLPDMGKYIHFALIADGFGKIELDKMVYGMGRPVLSLENVQNIILPLPPLAEQRRIVAEVERRLSIADGVEKTVGQSLTQAQRLRQSILKKAFEGRLVAQDASDEPAGVLLERIKQEKERIGRKRSISW